MNIIKQYRNGTTHLDNPSRNEQIQSVQILTDEYQIHINPSGITVLYKYIQVQTNNFQIGRWKYTRNALERYKGGEKKRIEHMYSVLNELLTEHSINCVAVNDWDVIQVLNSHVE